MKFEKYFGTDGIRGKVGFFPITPEFILKLGWASGKVLSCHGKSRKIIIGKDTRVSGYMLESALESGLSASGTSIALTGPIPTPAVAYLTRIFKASAGIVISASHNHYCDNGIKFFSVEGKKLINTIENRIEEQLNKSLICVKSQFLGKATRIVNASERYIKFCKKTFPKHLTLKGLKIVVDCANGATYQIAPNIFRELGADVITIGCKPNGFNINKRCGTTDVRQLRFRVLKNRANLGVAYDGDGDRVIMIDHHGNIISGDQILFVIAREQFRQKKLIGGVVGTLMSNMGLMLALKKLNIPFIRTSVGDRYILEMLQRKGWRIGGENSGHIILLDKTTTGDGIIVTLQVLSFMMTNCLSLYELCQGIFLFPQVLMNIYYSGSRNPLKSNLVIKVIKKIERELSNTGRLVLRFSGTEPCIRIMVEGEKSKISHMANEIATTIKTVC